MQGLEAWPPCHGSGDRDAAAEVTVAIRDDGYIARRAQDAILGCWTENTRLKTQMPRPQDLLTLPRCAAIDDIDDGSEYTRVNALYE